MLPKIRKDGRLATMTTFFGVNSLNRKFSQSNKNQNHSRREQIAITRYQDENIVKLTPAKNFPKSSKKKFVN